MTIKITPEAVKERIAALESAGELSLKEQFYLEALRQLVDAMDSEPVGIVRYVGAGERKSIHVSLYQQLPEGVEIFAAPQPAPVVPPAIEPDYEVIKGILPTSNPDEYACCIAADMWNACRAAMLQAGTLTNEGETILHNYRTAMEGIGHIRRTLEETFGGLHGTHVEPDVLMDCKTICDAIYAAYSGNSPAIPDSCTWHCEEDINNWHSDCGYQFQFTEDGPEENGVKFCPKCGKSIAVSATEGTEE